VLELIVKRGRALVDARSMVILLERDGELEVAAGAGEIAERALGQRIPIEGSAPGEVLRTGRPERLAEARSRLRMSLGEAGSGAEAVLLVPLQFRGRTSGVLLAIDRIAGDSAFDAEDERVAAAFASAAATAVATAQSVETERLERSIAGAEAERRRWARELHDQTLQGLGALQVMLRSAARKGSVDADLLERASEQLGVEIEGLQEIIADLRPAALDDIGLAAALTSLAERRSAAAALDLECDIDLAYENSRLPDRLSPSIEDAAFRLVQEAFNNIAKHAGATHVRLIVREGDQLDMRIEDDGTGFDPTATSNGFGLLGMRERAELAGGSLSFDSAPGAGTRVHVVLPARHNGAEGLQASSAVSA
jgi:signal transduction histidine kinase